MHALLLIASIVTFLVALLICGITAFRKRSPYRALGFIATCETIYFFAFFAALLSYTKQGSFIAWGAAAACGTSFAFRYIAAPVRSETALAFVLAIASFLSIATSPVSLGLDALQYGAGL